MGKCHVKRNITGDIPGIYRGYTGDILGIYRGYTGDMLGIGGLDGISPLDPLVMLILKKG